MQCNPLAFKYNKFYGFLLRRLEVGGMCAKAYKFCLIANNLKHEFKCRVDVTSYEIVYYYRWHAFGPFLVENLLF